MPFFGMYDPTIILLIPAILFTLYAQGKVNRAYKKYARVQNRTHMTGMQAARRVLDANGLRDVRIEMIPGNLTDHYDPRSRVMRLSQQVYSGATIASVSIAAHESGHAIQHGTGYGFLRFRNAIVPVVNLVSNLSWPLLVIGIIISGTGRVATGNLIFDIGVLFFAGVVVFHLVTLPVELNASSRAIAQLQTLGIVGNDEISGARKVLSAAAMTYVAALATAVLNLVRLLLIRERD
ncbi:zinc metallopeptidase [bacterium 210820-DFI.6.37]|nr:zinc metallopeptidase [bacterium 210820-DFI.6.37]